MQSFFAVDRAVQFPAVVVALLIDRCECLMQMFCAFLCRMRKDVHGRLLHQCAVWTNLQHCLQTYVFAIPVVVIEFLNRI